MMARETVEAMDRIISHYLSLGAQEVLVYWNGKDGELDELARPGLRVFFCDNDFFERNGSHAGDHLNNRLRAAYRAAKEDARSDWVLLVDADEFLISKQPFTAVLDKVPEDVDVLCIPNVEAVWGPGDDFGEGFASSYFRRSYNNMRGTRLLQALVYGPKIGSFFRNGLVAYSRGKQAVRCNRSYDVIRSHMTERDGKEIGRWAPEVLPADFEPVIAHYDAISLNRWREKFRRRYSGESVCATMRDSRAAQMDAIRSAAAKSDNATTQLCRRIYGLNRWQYTILKALGLAFRHPSFP